jgi:cell division protein FtsL
MARAAATTAGRAAPARRQPVPRRRLVAPPARPARRASGGARPKAARRPVVLPRGARVLDALLTGRVWIALVGVLLAGIVFFNVDLLRMNRDITQMAERSDALQRQNARIREDVAHLASSERVQEAAAKLGLVLPEPGDVRYLRSNPRIDARNASKRIIAPTQAYTAPVTTTPPATTTTQPTSTTTPPTTTDPQSAATSTTTGAQGATGATVPGSG